MFPPEAEEVGLHTGDGNNSICYQFSWSLRRHIRPASFREVMDYLLACQCGENDFL